MATGLTFGSIAVSTRYLVKIGGSTVIAENTSVSASAKEISRRYGCATSSRRHRILRVC